MTDTEQIGIRKKGFSGLDQVDFSYLPFGKIVSDHMFSAEFRNGVWQDMRIEPYAPIEMFPAMITLHYGQAIFEGLKAYRNKVDEIVLFRPDENAARFKKSAERLCMPPLPEDLFIEAISQLVALDKDWVPPADKGSLYIRPHMFGTDQYIGVHPSAVYRFIIFTCPTGPYFTKPTRVKIETEFSRACPGGIGAAKAAANYAAALLPTKVAIEQGYDQVIWTDSRDHKYIEEAGTMNVFFRVGDELITPLFDDTILDGITRKSVIEVAKDLGFQVVERKISVEEVIDAAKAGTLKEAFGAGTAATISPIAEIGYQGKDYSLEGPACNREFSHSIHRVLDQIRSGEMPDKHMWIRKVL